MPPDTDPLYADVIVPRHITKAFTYLVPAALAHTVAIGRKVLVPFGRTMLEGAVIALRDRPPRGMETIPLKEIRSLADDTPESEPAPARLELSRAIAEHYVAPWGQCLRLVQPRDPAERTSPLRYVATDQGRTALNSGTCPDHLQDMLNRIARRSRGILLSTVRKIHDRTSRKAIETLERLSWIAVVVSPAMKADHPKRTVKPAGHPDDRQDSSGRALFAEQLPEMDSLWIARINDCLRANQARKIVLHAPLEHRISRLAGAIQQVYAMGKSAIILSGEIAKVEWLGRLLSEITKLPVTVISPSSEYDHRIPAQVGNPSVMVGTRSAVFTRLGPIGLIWVDGEEDPAFKEPQEPRYHARDVAWMRAHMEGALLVLASAHPSLESVFDRGAEIHAVSSGPTFQPAIELVDLRHEPGGALFSQRLAEAMQEAMRSHAGILLFLNRKGYARTVICRDCGWMPRCPACAVTLAYSRAAGRLTCRYCGGGECLPQYCPLCRASQLNSVGDGTERVESDVRRLFPQAKIARLDSDSLRHASAVRDVWEGIRSGAWDIVIGTQALFQREPLPRRGLVGILQADSGLHVPDFRAAERTYQLLDEAVSLARPASAGGRVILQTRFPTHHAVQAVLSSDPHRFYDEELAARRLLHYPPACHLAALSVSGKDPRELETAASQWRSRLEESAHGENGLSILGPVPTTGRRPIGHHRYQLLAKETDRALLCSRIRESVESMEHDYRQRRIKFIVDMDPIDMG